jgi:hypothetical protein
MLSVSNDVRRHRLISCSYVSLLPCHDTFGNFWRIEEQERTRRKPMFVAMRGVFQLVLVSFEIVPVRALPDHWSPSTTLVAANFHS